jgi:hypothetical protein
MDSAECVDTEISATAIGAFYYPTDTGIRRHDGVKYRTVGGEIQLEKLGWEKEPVKRYYVTQLGAEIIDFDTTPVPKESPLIVDWVEQKPAGWAIDLVRGNLENYYLMTEQECLTFMAVMPVKIHRKWDDLRKTYGGPRYKDVFYVCSVEMTSDGRFIDGSIYFRKCA